MKVTKNFKKYTKDTINDYVYAKKYHKFQNYLSHVIQG